MDPKKHDMISIGELAQNTGLTVHTLRAWEQRYGRPRSHRLESGHRRYTEEECQYIRLVAMAVASGLRPSEAMEMPLDRLRSATAERGGLRNDADRREIRSLLHDYDDHGLAGWLDERLSDRQDAAFLDDVLGPAITFVGEAWKDGRIQIRHEHWFSSRVMPWLDDRARKTPREKRHPPFILATFQGEQHELGLKMCAFFLRRRGHPLRYLGSNIPSSEIEGAALESRSSVIMCSVASGSGTRPLLDELKTLRNNLPDDVILITGGRGLSPRSRLGHNVTHIDSFRRLEEWLDQF